MVENECTSLSLLRTVGLYRVATRSTLATCVPSQNEPDRCIKKLLLDGFLRAHKGLPGNRSVYQLTKKGAAAIGVSPARGRPIGAQSLLKNLGVLLFCHVPETERHRVEVDELGQSLGTSLSDGAYCMCRLKGRAVVFECYVPGPQTPITTVLRHLRKAYKAARVDPILTEAIKDLRYGFAVLVPNSSRRKGIMDAIRAPSEEERTPLIKRARIWVEAIPELGAVFGTAAPGLGHTQIDAKENLLWEVE